MKKVKIKQATKLGYVEMEVGGIFDATFPTSKYRRGRVQGDPPGSICPTLMANNHDGLLRIEGDKKMTKEEMIECLAIRKLTPTEAFRLQGMRDEDVEKCRAVGISNSSLYKIAGNGLVSNCVQYICEHLYKAIVDPNYQTTDEKAVADGYGV